MESNAEVLNYLKTRRNSLSIEIEALDKAIDALQSIEPNPTAMQVLQTVNAINVVHAIRNKSLPKNQKSKIPNVYSAKLKHPIKVKFAVKTLGNATVNEMVDYIVGLDKTADRNKLMVAISYAASILYKNGELDAVREGKANRYSLKSKTDKKEEAA